MMIRPLLLLITCLHLTHGTSVEMELDPPLKCEGITVPMCKGIGYNLTKMPNPFNHETQEEAGLEAHQFWPLVEIECSPDLKFFLCSMYVPICMEDYNDPLPACKSVCERAKSGCAPLMAKYGFVWPPRMECDDLPVYGDKSGRLCMDNRNDSANEQPTTKKVDYTYKPKKKHRPQQVFNNPNVPCTGKYCPTNKYPTRKKQPKCMCTCDESKGLVKINRTHRLFNRGISVSVVPNCALPCNGVFASPDERYFANLWISTCSILCCMATALTVLTFLIDMQRFKYPERPIIFLSGCYLMVSIGYLIRIAVGHEAVACDGKIVRYDSTGPLLCTAVFLLIFFFR